MTHSKRKGKTGELEFAAVLQEHGVDARRGQQYAGGGDSPDVVHDLGPVHFEVKRTEALRIWDAYGQAEGDAPEGHVPVVAWRNSRRPWMVTLSLEDFLNIYLELDSE